MPEYEEEFDVCTDDEVEQILGKNVLRMVDKLKFTPECNVHWPFELDDIKYEVTVKRT